MAGLDNVVADTLSRPPTVELRGVNAVAAETQQLDYNAIAAAQLTCPDTAAARDSSLTLHMVEFGPYKLLADMSGDCPMPSFRPPTAGRCSTPFMAPPTQVPRRPRG